MPDLIAENSIAESLSYERLSQTHQDYCETTLRDYWALYSGGKTLLGDPRLVAHMLPKEMGEHAQRYAERLRNATYINHFGKIVGFFVSAIFQQQVQVLVDGDPDRTDDYYERFQENADGAGNHLTQCLRRALVSAMVTKRGVLVVDFPKGPTLAKSELDQKQLGGARLPYVVHRDTKELINWKRDHDGTFKWCVFKRCVVRQDSPLDKPVYVEEFKLWTKTSNGAAWVVYETPPIPVGSEEYAAAVTGMAARGGKSSIVNMVDGGITSFKRVPVLCIEIEDDLWVGDRVAPLAKEHFQRRTALRTALGKHLFSIPFIKIGEDIPSTGGAVSTTPTDTSSIRENLASKGFVVLGPKDEVGFAEPLGKAYEMEARLEQELVDEMYRVGEQMSNSIAMTQTGVYRSGISKAEDRYGTELVLETYASRARAFAKQIMSLIAEARNEPNLEWEARGAEDFTLWDRNTTLAEAVNVDKISLPSETFHINYKTQVAARLIKDPTPEQVAKIRQELEENIKKSGVPDPRQERIDQQEAEMEMRKTAQREKGPVTSGQISGDVNKNPASKPSVTKV